MENKKKVQLEDFGGGKRFKFFRLLVAKLFFVRDWFCSLSYFTMSVLLVGVVIVLLTFFAWIIIPDVQAPVDVMNLLYLWNGNLVSADYCSAMFLLLFWWVDLVYKYRSPIPQGSFSSRRRVE